MKTLNAGGETYGRRLAWDPTGNWLACRSGPDNNKFENNFIRIWNTHSWKVVATLMGVANGWSITASPDGKWFLCGNNLIRTGTWESKTFRPANRCSLSHNWSHDSKYILAWTVDGDLKVISFKDQSYSLHQNLHIGRVVMVWSPDGKRFATGGAGGKLMIWDAAVKKPLLTLKLDTKIRTIDWSPDGLSIACGCQDGSIRIFKAHPSMPRNILSDEETNGIQKKLLSNFELKTLETRQSSSHQGKFLHVKTRMINNSGKTLYVPIRKRFLGFLHYRIQPLDEQTTTSFQYFKIVEKGQFEIGKKTIVVEPEIQAAQTYTLSESFSIMGFPIGRYRLHIEARTTSGDSVHTKAIDFQIKPTAFEILNALTGHFQSVHSLCYSPDGQTLASASADGKVILWDVSNGQPRAALVGHKSSVWSITFSPDGKTVASASHDKSIKLWDARTGQLKRTLKGSTGGVTAVCYSPDGQLLASTGWDKTVKLWNARTGKLKASLKGHTKPGWVVGFSPDGQTLLSGGDTTIRLWDVKTGRPKTILREHRGVVRSICFSPDGKLFATSSGDKTVKLWDAKTTKLLRTYKGHTGDVWTVCFSPDGKTLASACKVFDFTQRKFVPQGEVKLWDVATGKERATFAEGREAVCFSPDGQTLATAHDDGTITLWRLNATLAAKK